MKDQKDLRKALDTGFTLGIIFIGIISLLVGPLNWDYLLIILILSQIVMFIRNLILRKKDSKFDLNKELEDLNNVKN